MRFQAILLVLAGAASGQQFSASAIRVQKHEVSGIWGPPRAVAIVTGAPYSADDLQEYNPPDGSSAPRSGVIGHYARDSKGRIWKSEAFKPAPVWLTEIFDPLAGVAYLLDEQSKVAYEMALPPAPAGASAPPPPNVTTDNLGTGLIDGIAVDGTRTSSRMLTIETWKSPELQITLSTKSSNGYSGRLINLKRDEPDPALFRPPVGYTVIHQDRPFAMTLRFD
jgi:hypothetical protein